MQDVQLAKSKKLMERKGKGAEDVAEPARLNGKQPPLEQEGDLVEGAHSLNLSKGLPSRKSSKANRQDEAGVSAVKLAAQKGKRKKEPQQAPAASLWDNNSAQEVDEAAPSSDPIVTNATVPNEVLLQRKQKKMKGLHNDAAGRPLPEKSTRQGEGKPEGLAGATLNVTMKTLI